MKRLFIIFFLLCLPVFAANYNVDKATHEYYKKQLEDQGWLYGFAPANWSLTQPVRGGFNYAMMKNRLDIMELEVKAGLDIRKCSINALFNSIMFNNYKVLEFMLQNGYSPNATYLDHSLLTFSIYRKKPDCVKVLIEHNVDVNMEYKNKNPLNSAIKKKQPEIVKMLLDAGAKPNEKTLKLVEKSRNGEIKALFK